MNSHVPGSSWRRRRVPIHSQRRASLTHQETVAALLRSSRHSRFGTLMPHKDRNFCCSRARGFVASSDWTQLRSMATMSRDGSMLVAWHARFACHLFSKHTREFSCTVCSWRTLGCLVRQVVVVRAAQRHHAEERRAGIPDIAAAQMTNWKHGCPPRLLKKEFRNPEANGKKTNMFHSLFFVDLCEGPGSQLFHPMRCATGPSGPAPLHGFP